MIKWLVEDCTRLQRSCLQNINLWVKEKLLVVTRKSVKSRGISFDLTCGNPGE